MTATATNDVQIRDRVLEEMAYDPAVTANDIAVIVEDGVVTLDGIADSYGTRRAVELAAWRVYGVRDVLDKVEVKPQLLGQPTDDQIAVDLRQRLESDFLVPKGRINVSVEDGVATLRGAVRLHIQREAAKEEAEDTIGVRQVKNFIEIDRSSPSPTNIAHNIEKALTRNARVDAGNIQVRAEGRHVTLSGTARSAAERDEAINAAWRANGVAEVTDNITIQPF